MSFFFFCCTHLVSDWLSCCCFKCTIKVGYGETLSDCSTQDADAHCRSTYATLDKRDTMTSSDFSLPSQVSVKW